MPIGDVPFHIDFVYEQMVIDQPVFQCPQCHFLNFAEKPEQIEQKYWHNEYGPVASRYYIAALTGGSVHATVSVESEEFIWREPQYA